MLLEQAMLALDRGNARAALAAFEALGATSEARRAATLLGGLSAQGDRRATGPPEGLSRRELEVLRLMAEGLSNRQIA